VATIGAHRESRRFPLRTTWWKSPFRPFIYYMMYHRQLIELAMIAPTDSEAMALRRREAAELLPVKAALAENGD
jgi:hypothetical protein